MNSAVAQAISLCEWAKPSFLIFSDNVFDPLIYYSHLVPLLISIFLGVFIFYKNPEGLASKTILFTISFLSIWILGDLILWATDDPRLTMFFWSLINMVEPIIYAGILYFLYVYIDQRDISFRKKLIIFFLLTPSLILASTKFSLIGYDLTNCDRDAVEGILAYYNYFIEIVFILWILFSASEKFVRAKDKMTKDKILYVTIGSIGFLTAFAFGNIIGSLFDSYSIGGDYSWTIGQYGLFGVPLFMGFLSYLIVKFHAFNIKLIGTQALVATIWVLIASVLFINTIENVRVIIALTSILLLILGIKLVRSVKREVEQREKIESLAKSLRGVNRIMSHDIKNVLGKNKDLFLESLHGTFGPITEEAKSFYNLAYKDTVKLLSSIMTILESGQEVTLKKASFDFKQALEEIILEVKPDAEAKNLSLETKIESSDYNIMGDKNQIVLHVLENLIRNAINYTLKGSITIHLSKKKDSQDKEFVSLEVKDTGIGITEEDKKLLFTEGGHGKESLKVNVHTTGYGLYIAKRIVEAHKGRVWAESEGAGKGSTFIVELPIS